VITTLPAGEYAAPGSSGKRIPDFDVRIVDDLDRELPANTPGEIVCDHCGRTSCSWAIGAVRKTLKLMRNMWFHTGDIGKFDDEGYFYFVDRKKDYLRRRARISPASRWRAHSQITPKLPRSPCTQFRLTRAKTTSRSLRS
jgi:crotonobetaine/carnitine-CoA ligase